MKGMKNVDGFLEFGDVDDAVDAAGVLDANLSGTNPDIVEWLPVHRLQTGLHFAELKSGFPARRLRKRQQVVLGRSDPADLFLVEHTAGVYKSLYVACRRVNVRRDMSAGTCGPHERLSARSRYRRLRSFGDARYSQACIPILLSELQVLRDYGVAFGAQLRDRVTGRGLQHLCFGGGSFRQVTLVRIGRN